MPRWVMSARLASLVLKGLKFAPWDAVAIGLAPRVELEERRRSHLVVDVVGHGSS
jgi:hypothetical protein